MDILLKYFLIYASLSMCVHLQSLFTLLVLSAHFHTVSTCNLEFAMLGTEPLLILPNTTHLFFLISIINRNLLGLGTPTRAVHKRNC